MKHSMRLDKVLAHMGWGSRSEIRKLVKSGAVRINQQQVKDSGLRIHPYDDEIVVNDEQVIYREFIYLMLNKPKGVISATEDAKDRTVIDLLTDKYKHFRPFPVGRLDKDTEGLLLLTNDGQLAHNLLSPKKQVAKVYYAQVEGTLTEQHTAKFKQGITLDDGYTTLPAILEPIEVDSGKSSAYVTISEGKFHQVKRMFLAVECKVVYLQRIQMGSLKLDRNLPIGHYRELTTEEYNGLKGGDH